MRTPALAVLCFCAFSAFSQNKANDFLFPIREGRKFGFINRSGVLVVTPQYDAVAEPKEGLARVSAGSLSGYIDLSGKVVVEPKWESAEDFRDGRAIVRVGPKYSLIDTSGKMIAEIPHRVLGEFHQGLLRVQVSGATDSTGRKLPTTYGFVDGTGKMVIPAQFMPAGEFPDNPADLPVGGLDHDGCYFDKTGNIIIRVSMGEHLTNANLFANGRLRAKEGFTWGYKDATGAWAIPAKYNDAQTFKDGVARVQDGAKWILIGVNGQVLPEDVRKLRPIQPPSEGLALARENDVMGWIDADGKPAFPLRKYEEAHGFAGGRARIKVDGLYGYLDRTGALKIPNQYHSAADFSHGLAFVQTREGIAYIDAEGKTVWKSTPAPKVELR